MSNERLDKSLPFSSCWRGNKKSYHQSPSIAISSDSHVNTIESDIMEVINSERLSLPKLSLESFIVAERLAQIRASNVRRETAVSKPRRTAIETETLFSSLNEL